MQLVPAAHEVLELLRRNGALRRGHFEYAEGFHGDAFLDLALAMRYYQVAKILSVALSRLLRANPEIRAALGELSIVAPAYGSLPVAYGVCEALSARQVYWAEPSGCDQQLRFPQNIAPLPGEKVVLVADIVRTGRTMTELRHVVERLGAQVMAIAALVLQPISSAVDFGSLPVYSLARLEGVEYFQASSCRLCRSGVPLDRVGRPLVEAAIA